MSARLTVRRSMKAVCDGAKRLTARRVAVWTGRRREGYWRLAGAGAGAPENGATIRPVSIGAAGAPAIDRLRKGPATCRAGTCLPMVAGGRKAAP